MHGSRHHHQQREGDENESAMAYGEPTGQHGERPHQLLAVILLINAATGIINGVNAV
ncbi:hypothetical protein [Vreelandella arcis]|uniref:hypothetical protein n=1 Tax=Vreelandella arcis TaxID=416873 RepID=UPI001FCDF80F|nr:hypothetical protein [Halomonas arcis]